MRIAVLSDIHGNLPALESALEDLRTQSPDQIWCAGDLGWAGGWARECVELVRAEGWPTVKGNTDVWITGDPQTLESLGDRQEFESIAKGHDLSEDDAAWLLNLPVGHNGPGSLLMVHGTPQSPFDAPMPDAPAADFAPFEDQAALVVYGHVHRAFVRRLAGGGLVCNPGSVGAPMDHSLGSYLVIDRDGVDLTLRHRRIEFDREACRRKAEDVGEPIKGLFLRNLGFDA